MRAFRYRPGAITLSFGLLAMFTVSFLTEQADARPAKCFGKRINRVVTGSNQTVRLGYRDVVWVAGDRVTVIAKPYTVVCADKGRQTVKAGKGRSLIRTGADSDRIYLHDKSNMNRIYAGLGNDFVRGSKGHDFIYASPRSNPRKVPDRDTVYGFGGNDRIYDYSGVGNRLYGHTGVDRIHSMGDAVSSSYGGNGSDYLYTTGGRSGASIERLFGERGNDRLRGDTAPTNGPAFLDSGVGDDWIYGTDADDTIITQSGITKIQARGGADLIISGSRGKVSIDGGSGEDTVSYASHTPPQGGDGGVNVNLANGSARGNFSRAPWHSLSGIENAEGSPFDDALTGKPGEDNRLEGGLGDDELSGNQGDRDRADGGIGRNQCYGFASADRCNGNSPGRPDGSRPVVDINRGGVLTVIGSSSADRIEVGYQQSGNRYRVDLNGFPLTSGQCQAVSGGGNAAVCEAPAGNLNGIVAHGGAGDDRIEIAGSVSARVTTSINGGSGRNVLLGGASKDYIETADGSSSGSTLDGRGNSDVIYVDDDVRASGGSGSDVIQVRSPCRGGSVSGGSGTDNLVFARSAQGVDADLARGSAKWHNGACRDPLKMAHDIENLEGSQHRDRLALGRRSKSQQGRGSLLGRDGNDILDSRNGVRDTITTGGGGRNNTVIADRFDKVIWGWGYAAF